MTWASEVMAARPVWERAPSAHNTQPWTLRVDDDALVLGWSPERELRVTDPTRRDLWLSLGAFAEAVVIAARDLGHEVSVRWAIDARRQHAAVLTRAPRADRPGDSGSIAFDGTDLTARRTARGPYADPPVTAEQLSAIAAQAAVGECRLDLLAPELIAGLLPHADQWSYHSPAHVEELRAWLRLERDDPAYARDGLSAEALGLTEAQARALRMALSPTGWRVLARLGGPTMLARAGQQDGLGRVVALHTESRAATAPERVAEAGRALLRTWLAAARHGLSVHPLSQLIDCPSTAPALDAAVPGPQRRVLSVFRMGTPRRPPVRAARLGDGPPVVDQAR